VSIELLAARPPWYLAGFAAVPVAFVGSRLVRRALRTSVVTREAITWQTARPQRRHVVGSVVFGVGWAVSSSCPGPIAAQLGRGMLWSLFTIAGIVVGIVLYSSRAARASAVPVRTATRDRVATAPSPGR
jgi:uncharacterized membrane protein YedE/YeeE